MAKAELRATAPSHTDLLGKPKQAWVWAEDHTAQGQCGHPQALPLRVEQAQARLSHQGGGGGGRWADEKVGSHRD